MQSLLRRCLSSVPTFLCTVPDSTSGSLPLSRKVLAFGLHRKASDTLYPVQLGMHTAAALHLHQPVGCAVKDFSWRRSPTASCNVGSFWNFSKCSVSTSSFAGGSVITAKPWIFYFGKSSGSFFAPFTTCRGGTDASSLKDFGENAEMDGVNGKDLDMKLSGGSEEDGGDTTAKDSSCLEEKPLKLHRRQRSGSSAVGLPGNPDLLTIPGVGPRNLRKLVEKGIGGVAELKQLYKDKFFGKSREKMVEFLQSSVGIFHRSHAERITTFIKDRVDEELKNVDGKPTPKKRLTFCVEGNISVGKTTFLQRIANETLELQDLVEIVPEPIDKWQNVGPDHFNILDAFYAEPHRYAYTFQNYVFVTRVMQERESAGGMKPLRLMERSVFSDRMVFVRAVHEANWMNEMEISIYDSWFDPVVSCLPGLIPDGFIYLRASPDTCHKRMMLRKRAEEGGVSLDYLCDLHEKHESWLFPFQSGNHRVLSVNKLPLGVDSILHPDIKDRVFYLEGAHMHSSIQKVPALVLDCEPNIDFSKDIEAKRQYARQVAEFFEFVKKRQEISDSKPSDEATKGGQPQVLLPQEGGLWLSGGGHFSKSALEAMDIRRAMRPIMSG